MVMSFTPKSDNLVYGTVMGTIVRTKRTVYELVFDDGGSVTCTAEHPFYVKTVRRGVTPIHETFVRAKDLIPSDNVVRLVKGVPKEVAVTSVSVTSKKVKVYNLNVMHEHTYIAGGCLVHNVKMFAEGGYADSPTLGIFGEAGPEYVIPQAKLMSLMASSRSTGNITVVMQLDGTEIARKTAPITANMIRMRQGVR
jgi:hypothetical protein